MVKGWSFFFVNILIIATLSGQFTSVNVTIDDRLLRSEEKQDIINLSNDVKHFFQNTTWNDTYSDIKIDLYVQIIFESVTMKGNETIYNSQAMFSNGKDLRYFDKSIQFYYNSSTNLYYDPVLFEPLTGFLAFYGHLILAGEIDTYEFNGGNGSYELARNIAIRGSASDYKKGWSNRINDVDDLSRNIGLRKARLACYIAMDLFEEGDIDGTIKELNIMLDGLDESYRDIGRDNSTQYFLKVKSERIAEVFAILGRKELLKDMKELDPDRRDIYNSYLETISK
jgi:hypothetical protein|tara:strand:+ start:435 stop:1283 length:849 start_codon:yes stop_codon:yes gene_type:complete